MICVIFMRETVMRVDKVEDTKRDMRESRDRDTETMMALNIADKLNTKSDQEPGIDFFISMLQLCSSSGGRRCLLDHSL